MKSLALRSISPEPRHAIQSARAFARCNNLKVGHISQGDIVAMAHADVDTTDKCRWTLLSSALREPSDSRTSLQLRPRHEFSVDGDSSCEFGNMSRRMPPLRTTLPTPNPFPQPVEIRL